MHYLVLISLFFSLQAFGATLISRQFPSLLIPVSQDAPNTALGTQYTGQVAIRNGSHQIYTEVLFDIPPNAATSCNLSFSISTSRPAPWTLTPSPPFPGPFIFNISTLSSAPNKCLDTWNHRPSVKDWVATVEVKHDGSVKMTGGKVGCLKGQTANFLVYPGRAGTMGLEWFEEADPVHGITYEMWTDE
ncbi:hypothetical protein GQ43DRAFT_474291 [Delitschia confertaspora ATCC 74209]|uniref:Ubiquitin 3 binding protein But2 C-terminal domain-containing protein n=1 Tax=Delitschia confertaspora ATCC 74209 TaxID=1513339 RepID=A0A9P4MMW0_9PLEO|nr:hypothetical protein GQ43DRAFT_474291 [Delitschia confertaspora ATCC 74209]